MTDALNTGAGGVVQLLARLREISDATCMQDPDAQTDTRDYVAAAAAVRESITANLTHADPMHAQGYLRALTDLLMVTADGCGIVASEWRPIENTARAFEVEAHHA